MNRGVAHAVSVLLDGSLGHTPMLLPIVPLG